MAHFIASSALGRKDGDAASARSRVSTPVNVMAVALFKIADHVVDIEACCASLFKNVSALARIFFRVVVKHTSVSDFGSHGVAVHRLVDKVVGQTLTLIGRVVTSGLCVLRTVVMTVAAWFSTRRRGKNNDSDGNQSQDQKRVHLKIRRDYNPVLFFSLARKQFY